MLKRHIEDNGISREDLARRLGISRPYLSLLELGKRVPSLDLAIRIDRETGGAVPVGSWIAGRDGRARGGAA